MALWLGLDAGGTKTECALADSSGVLARGVGGSIKPLRVSREQARDNLHALMATVSRESGRDLSGTVAACVGTAGVRLPETNAWMREIFEGQIGLGQLLVCGDEEIALDAAFPGRAGVLAMAGTGSNVIGRASSGEKLNVGGWGPALGDEGSGYWIGHEALVAAFRALDFGTRSMLLDGVIELWGATNRGEVVSLANATPAPDFSRLAKMVASFAEAGDAVCHEVLERGGRLLGEDVVEAFRRVRQLDSEAMPGIAFTGSVLRHMPIVREAMIGAIRRPLPTAEIRPEAVDPVLGAIWRAQQAVRR